MRLKIKYKPELGLPDFETNTQNLKVDSPMAIYLHCKDGKKRNADATLKETVLSMFFTTRGLYNFFDSDIESIEVDGIKGLHKAESEQNVINSKIVFHSRYKVCNWKVSLGSIDEFYYVTHNTSDSDYGTIKYRETYANELRKKNIFSQFIDDNDVISDFNFEDFKRRMIQLAGFLQAGKIGLRLMTDNNSFVFKYNAYDIYTMDDADRVILNDEAYTIFLFTNLLLNRILRFSRFDMIYIDAEGMSPKMLSLFKMITQVLKNSRDGTGDIDYNVNLIFYNLTKSQVEEIKKDAFCQVIELPNSREVREMLNMSKEKK